MNQCFGLECQNNSFGQNFFGAELPFLNAGPLGLNHSFGLNPLGAQPGLDLLGGFGGFGAPTYPGLQSSFPF